MENKKVSKEEFNNSLDKVMEYLKENGIVCLLLDPERRRIISPSGKGMSASETKAILGDRYFIDITDGNAKKEEKHEN